jgi:thymidylate kinase
VLADRYVYTAFARDVARRVDRCGSALYRFAPVPTLAFYFRTPLEVALKRILTRPPKLKHYEAGMDLDLHPDPSESYRIFQSAILVEYEKLRPGVRAHVMDARAAGRAAAAVAARTHSDRCSDRPAEAPACDALRPTAAAIPGLQLARLSGWLIVVEGTDGVGRTTHIDRLRAHSRALRLRGGRDRLTRSDLASRGIRRRQEGNTLGSTAYNLYYATDFADRLEHQIMPALRSGS